MVNKRIWTEIKLMLILLLDKVEQHIVICQWRADQAEANNNLICETLTNHYYFSITEFNNDSFLIWSPNLFFKGISSGSEAICHVHTMEKSLVPFMQEQNIIYLLPGKNFNCKSWWDIELCNADKIQAISFNKDKIDPIDILK